MRVQELHTVVQPAAFCASKRLRIAVQLNQAIGSRSRRGVKSINVLGNCPREQAEALQFDQRNVAIVRPLGSGVLKSLGQVLPPPQAYRFVCHEILVREWLLGASGP